MKKKFLQFSLNLIKQNNPDLDEIKLDEIRYGLEALYLTITKTIVVFLIASYFKTIKETLLLLIFYNILRETAFGLHASKSWMCWASSIIIFNLGPIILKQIVIPLPIKIVSAIIAIILIIIYAPADTKKAPIIYKKKRTKYKIFSSISCVVLCVLAIVNNGNISTFILAGIYIEIILILPITYKIFKLPYRNYLSYVPSN